MASFLLSACRVSISRFWSVGQLPNGIPPFLMDDDSQHKKAVIQWEFFSLICCVFTDKMRRFGGGCVVVLEVENGPRFSHFLLSETKNKSPGPRSCRSNAGWSVRLGRAKSWCIDRSDSSLVQVTGEPFFIVAACAAPLSGRANRARRVSLAVRLSMMMVMMTFWKRNGCFHFFFPRSRSRTNRASILLLLLRSTTDQKQSRNIQSNSRILGKKEKNKERRKEEGKKKGKVKLFLYVALFRLVGDYDR